jgi:hypothetical protein
MPKRTFWLVAGVAVGAGSSLWVERRVRRTVHEAAARLQPDALVAEVGRTARRAGEAAGDRLRDAMAVGRVEMRQHEERLWDQLADRGVEPPDPYPGDGGETGEMPVTDGAGRPPAVQTVASLDPSVQPAQPVQAAQQRSPSRRNRRRSRQPQAPSGFQAAKSPSHLAN